MSVGASVTFASPDPVASGGIAMIAEDSEKSSVSKQSEIANDAAEIPSDPVCSDGPRPSITSSSIRSHLSAEQDALVRQIALATTSSVEAMLLRALEDFGTRFTDKLLQHADGKLERLPSSGSAATIVNDEARVPSHGSFASFSAHPPERQVSGTLSTSSLPSPGSPTSAAPELLDRHASRLPSNGSAMQSSTQRLQTANSGLSQATSAASSGSCSIASVPPAGTHIAYSSGGSAATPASPCSPGSPSYFSDVEARNAEMELQTRKRRPSILSKQSGSGSILEQSRPTARRPSHLSTGSKPNFSSVFGAVRKGSPRRLSKLSNASSNHSSMFSLNYGESERESNAGSVGPRTGGGTSREKLSSHPSMKQLESLLASQLLKKHSPQHTPPQHTPRLSERSERSLAPSSYFQTETSSRRLSERSLPSQAPSQNSEAFDDFEVQCPSTPHESEGERSYHSPSHSEKARMHSEEPQDKEEPCANVLGNPTAGRFSAYEIGKSASGRFSEMFSGMADASFTPNSLPNLGSMRQEHVRAILAEAWDSCGSDASEEFGPWFVWLRVVSILPWASSKNRTCVSLCFSHLYRGLVLALVFGLVLLGLHQFIELENQEMRSSFGEFYFSDLLLPILAISFACFSSLFLLGWQNDWVVGDPEALLTGYAFSQGLLESWAPIAYHDMAKILFCWACVVGWSVYASLNWNLGGNSAYACVAALAFISNVFASLMFAILHICRGLLLALDNFCTRFVSSLDCDAGVHDWNVLQAMLRQVCHSVAPVYVMLLTGAVVALFLPILCRTSLWAMTPGFFALLVLFWVSLAIGEVSSKCDRVSVFVNMIEFMENLDSRRQYLVNFITNSRAGFYMFEVRITAEMVVKSVYIGTVVIIYGVTFTIDRMT